MSQYSWVTCPPPVKAQVNTFCAHLQALLETNLSGIYLHGSLAMGCFNPDRSDIDLLVVTSQGMSIETKRRVVQLLLHSSMTPNPIEISFLVEQQLHPFRHPLPFDLHYGESHREQYHQALISGEWMRWNDETRSDIDLAAHLTVTLARGICLSSKPIKVVFPAVPAQYYAASIVDDFQWGKDRMVDNPVYFILNACRVYAYVLEGDIFSKDEGGSWGLLNLPGEYHSVITQALEIYRGNRKDEPFDSAALDLFAAYMDEQLKNLLETKGKRPL